MATMNATSTEHDVSTPVEEPWLDSLELPVTAGATTPTSVGAVSAADRRRWLVVALLGLVLLTGTIVNVASVWDRVSTYAQYQAQVQLRRWTNPGQTLWDCLTFTCMTEDVIGAHAILLQDGELYNGGDYCGKEMECITGVEGMTRHGATTVGHTVTFQRSRAPSEAIVRHEAQHMYDAENLGGLPYSLLYQGSSMAERLTGDDPYHNFFERRAYRYNPVKGEGVPRAEGPRGVLSESLF